MSFVFSLIRRANSDGRLSTNKPSNLSNIKDPTKFLLPSEKQVDYVQDKLVEKGDLKLFTEVETYLLNKQKIKYLEEIVFSLPSLYFWLSSIDSTEYASSLSTLKTVRLVLMRMISPFGLTISFTLSARYESLGSNSILRLF